jgi:hypothetical protein
MLKKEYLCLPVLAAANASVGAAQIQMSENFILRYRGLIFFFLFSFDFSGIVLLSLLVFLS